MLIYACDSTAQTASVAVCDGEHLLCEFSQNTGNTHSETLLPMTETMFRSLRISAEDIGLFVCSAGPGSFTGVRIGAAHIKGLAFGRSVPCVGVSSLEALAYNVKNQADILAPVMDARRSQLYTAFFSTGPDGKLCRITEDRAISAAQYADEVRKFAAAGKTVMPVGDGYKVAVSWLDGGVYLPCPERLRWQSAYSVAQTGYAAYQAGNITDAKSLKPVYLRLPQAERERLERLSAASQKTE